MKEHKHERGLVLIADDDEAMRQMLAVSLRSEGFEVGECQDGTALLDRLRQAKGEDSEPCLVVTDMRMPGVDGLDVLHWLRRWVPGVPVILITAFGDVRTHQRALELGATRVLDKPFDLRELHDAAVDAILDRSMSAAQTTS